uniref:Uncharacterized protein n=1 Tax=Onchocerca volvulus TaxID=6282 RepID=A0A2K6VLR2_ONCVO
MFASSRIVKLIHINADCRNDAILQQAYMFDSHRINNVGSSSGFICCGSSENKPMFGNEDIDNFGFLWSY